MSALEDIKERIVKLETQVHRFAADLESEKGTRARTNADLELRLRKVEVANWKAAGAISVIVVLAQYFIPKLFP